MDKLAESIWAKPITSIKGWSKSNFVRNQTHCVYTRETESEDGIIDADDWMQQNSS